MAGSVNKVILVGNLGRDPEIRNTQDGMKVVNLSVATSERWKDRMSGEPRERVRDERLHGEPRDEEKEQILRRVARRPELVAAARVRGAVARRVQELDRQLVLSMPLHSQHHL